MSQGTCLLCFSVTKVLDIKYTHLQDVYEELSDTEVQGDSHPLCYICHTKLQQCKQMLKQIEKNSNVCQPAVTSLVHLDIFSTDNNWSLPNNYIEIELEPIVIKEEYKEADVNTNLSHCALKTEIEVECIKEEQVEDPSHYDNETALEPVEDQHVPTEPQTQNDSTHHACDVCNKKFPYSSYLKRHKVIHADVKPYSCDVCSKTFTQTSSLKAHKLKHNDVKPYSCDVCSKTFTQSNSLKTHKVIHSGEKPYSCDVCSKTFTQSYRLKTHKLIHTGQKPYSCDVCSKRFTQSYRLKTHKVLHTREKPYT